MPGCRGQTPVKALDGVGCVCMCVILLLATSFLVLSPPTAPNLLRLKGSKELAVLLVPV